MVKKTDRAANLADRESRRRQYELEEAAMQAFLDECQACMRPKDWERCLDEAKRCAGETFHIVEHLVFVLASTQLPIAPRLRKAIDAMLVALNIDRNNCAWKELRQLNYDDYWKKQYGL